MTLWLALETSTADYGVALGADGAVLCDVIAGPDTPRDLAASVAGLLAHAGAKVGDIAAIGVDIGPGSLGSLRDGINFANALAYAIGAHVYAYTSFELIGAVLRAEGPVLCARRANEGLAYAGLFEDGAVRRMRRGPLHTIVPELAAGRSVLCAGGLRTEAAALLGARVSDCAGPRAATMVALGAAGRAPCDPLRAPALPLNERSPVFHD